MLNTLLLVMASLAPVPFTEDVKGLPEAKAPELVELKDGASYTLTAAPVKQRLAGRWVRRLAYNGSVPGPTLKVPQGATVRVTLKNAIEVDTTLHPHGLRVDNKNDGIPGISQPPIEPGGTHDYALQFPDPGMFWYHPHIREDYTQDAGLYGNFWVVPKDPTYYAAVHREIPLVIDDALLKDPKPNFKDRTTHTLMGRYGDVLLVNGIDTFEMPATTGEVIRFFITNTANTRTFALTVAGVKLKLVGGDNGNYERETWVEQLTIAPSERYVVEMQMPKPGRYDIVNDKPDGKMVAGTIVVNDGKLPPLASPFEPLRSPTPAAKDLATARANLDAPVAHTVRLSLTMDHKALPMKHMQVTGKNPAPIEWNDEMAETNAKSDGNSVSWKMIDEQTKKENMGIDWKLKLGQLVKIRIINDKGSMHPMQHPIHFHGQRFVIASVDGKQNDNLVWKDSALVRSGETMDILLEASRVGNWMAHCHIAEHLSAGMMLGFSVVP